jgi:hypothetical protein
MSKSSYLSANVEVTTDSFGGWINKTNLIINDMGTVVVTVADVAQPNTTNGAQTTGNSHIEGRFSANTLIAATALRGGTVSTPANLVITTNTIFNESALVQISANTNLFDVDANNVVISSNVTFDGGSTKKILIDAANTTINTGSLFVRSNTEFTGTSANVGTTTLNVTANSTFSGANVYITSTNTTIGNAGTDVLNVNAVADFNANVNIDGILTQTANAVFTGANVQIDSALTTIGNATTDLVVVNAYLNSDLIPNATTIDLGTDAKPYGNVHTTYVWSDNNIESQGDVVIKGSTTRTLKTLSTTTTQQTLNVVLENSAAATFTPIVANTSGVHSGANTTYDLGSTGINWRNLYVKDAAIANSAVITNVLTINSQANTASLMVRDLTATRVPYIGTAGEIVDSANLVFSGTGLNIIGTANVTTNANVGGTFGVTGATTLSSTLAVTGIATFSSNAVFSDSDYLVLGTGADLLIYHDGTHSYITDSGTGNLKIDASQLDIVTSNTTVTETMATFVREGAVTLFHDNTARLATSGTGVSVTGILAVSSNETVAGTLGVTGASTFANTVGVTGAATFANTVGVTGAATLSSTLGVTGATTFANTVGVTGVATFSNNIVMADNRTIIMGDSQDFMIYHDGSHSYVSDLGTGNLKLDASQLDIQTSNSTATETMATFVRDGAVTLFHDNTARIATTATGASVTGILAVSGNETVGGTLAVTGASTFANTIAVTGAATFSNTVGITGTTTAAAITASGLIDLTNTTDATSTTAAAIKTAGGLAVAKKLYVGTEAVLAGNTTIGAGKYLTTPYANVTTDLVVGGNTSVNNLTITGTTTLSSSITLTVNTAAFTTASVTGNLTFDTAATVTGNLIPSSNNAQDIGGGLKVWRTVYANNIVANVAWASVTDKPDPNIVVTLTGDVTGTANATLTDLANGTISITTTIASNAVALGTDTTGNYVATMADGTPSTQTGTSGLTITAAAGEGTAATIAHADTSSVSNLAIDNSNGNVLQDLSLTFDTFGHVTGTSSASVNLDLRYPQSAFTNIAVAGQTTVVSDSLTDTLTLVGAGIASITTNATTDTITITATEADTLATVTSRGNTTTNSITVNDINANNVVISGNLTVSGTTTYINTTTLNIGDNIVTLNADYTGTTPSENAGIEVRRGTLANTALLWNETNDRWTFTNDGTNYFNIPISSEYDNYSSWTIQDGDTTTYTITSGDTLQIASGTGITSNFTADDVLTITNTDRGSSQNIFKNIAISGQSTVVADSNDDTLTLVNGAYVTITANATADEITVAHNNTTRTDATSTAAPSYGGTFTAIDSVTTNATGHVTAVNVKTVTIPASDNTNTTYDLLAVANTAANAGIIRLRDSASANDDVLVTGSGIVTVSSNATHIVVNAPSPAGTNLSLTSNGSTVSVNSDTGTDVTILAANATTAGVLTAEAQTIAGVKTFTSTIAGAVTNGALTTGTLAQFAATTSSQLAGIISDETGTGSLVFSASPTFTGTPLAPTAAVGTNTTQIATTAFVNSEIANDIASKANLASPTFTGVPLAPTAAVGTNTTQLATTAFVNAEIANDITGKADLASPTFTGVPLAPTAAVGTNTTQLATTAFVNAEIANDITGKADLDSPTFTGVPLAPTASVGTNNTQLATTAFVNAEIANDIATKANLASPTFTGDVTSPTLRLTATAAANTTSTGHAFQIGLSTSTNLIIDTNEIMARNNGATATLNLNTDGGTVSAGGDLTVTGDITSVSDVRVKENVATIDSALNKVSNLRGVYYNKIGETERKLGVIAQEVEAIIPEVVNSDSEGMKSVAYANMVGLLIEAIKELKAEIDMMKNS